MTQKIRAILRGGCLVLLLTCAVAHAAREPLTEIPLYAPGFELEAEGMMRVQFVPLAGKELRSVAVHANG